MRSIGCHEPKVKPIALAAVRSYYTSLKACLDRAWPATVMAAGYQFRVPPMTIWSGAIQTPCGASTKYVSFYCGGDERIYPSGEEIVYVYHNWGTVQARRWATHVLPHEYGHHIQELSGMFQAYGRLYNQAPSAASKDQLTRRLELQASCLGHMFLAANKNSYPYTSQMLHDWSWRTITIANHGSVANQRYWISRGIALKRPGACNTWAAPAARVS